MPAAECAALHGALQTLLLLYRVRKPPRCNQFQNGLVCGHKLGSADHAVVMHGSMQLRHAAPLRCLVDVFGAGVGLLQPSKAFRSIALSLRPKMPLPALDAAQPEHFYLPKPSLARYAGFEAVVEGTRLPLNADRLVEANVLDALFEELHSGDVLGPGQVRGGAPAI